MAFTVNESVTAKKFHGQLQEIDICPSATSSYSYSAKLRSSTRLSCALLLITWFYQIINKYHALEISITVGTQYFTMDKTYCNTGGTGCAWLHWG